MVRTSHLFLFIGIGLMSGLVLALDAGAEGGPSLVVTEPLDNTLTNRSTIWVRGLTTPDTLVNASIDSSYFRAYPEQKPRNTTVSGPDGGFALRISLSEGIQKLWVGATDGVGNLTEVDLNVILDSTPHVQKIIQPPESPWMTNLDTFTVIFATQCECVPEITTVNGVEVRHTGVVETPVDLVEGENKIKIVTIDKAENYWTTTFVIIKDTVPPELVVDIENGEDVYINETPYVLSGFVSGASGPVRLTSDWNERPATRINGSWEDGAEWELFFGVLDERQSFNISARDVAGNIASQGVNIFYDIDPPDLSLEQMPEYERSPFVWLNGTTSKDIDIMYINDIPFPVTNGVFEVQWLIDEGDNPVTIKVMDKAGNTRTEAFIVKHDPEPPAIGLDVKGLTLGSDFHIKGRTDSQGGVLYINGEPHPLDTREFDIQQPLSEGVNTFKIVIEDRAGNTTTRTVSVLYINPWLIVIIILMPIMCLALVRWNKVRSNARRAE
jgi:hypothetical protein